VGWTSPQPAASDGKIAWRRSPHACSINTNLIAFLLELDGLASLKLGATYVDASLPKDDVISVSRHYETIF